jgi:hypothetical protein
MRAEKETAHRSDQRCAREGLCHSTRAERRPHFPHSMLERQVRRIASGRSSLADIEADTLRLLALYGAAAMLGALRVVASEILAAEARR